MKELLIILQREFITNANNRFNHYRGLCFAVHRLLLSNNITLDEHNKLIKYIKSYGRTQPTQFDDKGNSVKDTSKFIWKMFDRQSRLDWLELKIKRARFARVK
jgi:hypothetical protein